jgi:hypothetical protein
MENRTALDKTNAKKRNEKKRKDDENSKIWRTPMDGEEILCTM